MSSPAEQGPEPAAAQSVSPDRKVLKGSRGSQNVLRRGAVSSRARSTAAAALKRSVRPSSSPYVDLMASAFWVPIIFISSSYMLYCLSTNHPPLNLDQASNQTVRKYAGGLRFPSNFEDLIQMAHALQRYKVENIAYLLVLFTTAYIYKQTFAIPGSVFMNLLGGALFGMMAFPLVCILTAFGATNCYLLSRTFGKKQVVRFFPDKVKYFENKLKENHDSVFYFLLFLRMFPMSPNWLMNIIAPIVGVPLRYFFLTVLIGLAPYNFLCVQTGSVLSSLNSLDDVFTPSTILMLLGIAVTASLPGILIKFRQRVANRTKAHTD